MERSTFSIEPIDYGQLIADVELAFAEDLKKRNEFLERTSLLVRWQTLTPRETEVFRLELARPPLNIGRASAISGGSEEANRV